MRSERLHSIDDQAAWNDRYGEGFRMPAIAGRASGHGAGVRKPPKHEPAGLRRWSMGISRFAWLWRRRNRLGVGTGESLVSEIFRRARRRIGIWPRLISSTFAVILVKGVPGRIRRNGGVAARGERKPCRVTTGCSRLMRAREVARGVGSIARRSR